MPKPTQTQKKATLASHAMAGAWAIDPAFPLDATMATLAEGIAAHNKHDRDASHYEKMLDGTGGFTYFLNPDGSRVSILAEDAGALIQQGAIAVVPLQGVMVKSCPDWYQMYGVTSTERATSSVAMAAKDARIATIIVHAYTPGGMVYGTDVLSQTIKAAAGIKGVVTHISDLCASAGVFATAHSTTINVDSKSATVGSIGTMTTVVNTDKMWEEMGVEWIEIYATAAVDKNAAYNEAEQGDTKKMVAQLDALNEVFMDTVREGRGDKLSKKENTLTGKMYVAKDAIAFGLVDGIATLQESIALALANVERTEENNPKPEPMNKFQKAAQAVKEFFGFANASTEPNSEQLAQANEALKAEGIEGAVMVTASQFAELGTLATVKGERDAALAAKATAEAATATAKGLQTAAETKASEIETTLTAALAEEEVTPAEGATAVETVVATLKKWGKADGEQHAGGKKDGDEEPTGAEKYPSLAIAKKRGMRIGEKEAK